MYIAIAPSLLAATRTAMLLWTMATGVKFTEVATCAPYENRHISCISVYQTKSLPTPYAGKTYRFEDQYVTLVVDASPLVLSHELGHALISMNYHASPNSSIMSAYIGKSKCLTEEDAEAYEDLHDKPLTPLCLP